MAYVEIGSIELFQYMATFPEGVTNSELNKTYSMHPDFY